MQQYHNFLQRCSHHRHHFKFATLLKTPQNLHYKWRTTIISSWSLDNDLPALWACSLPGQLFRVTDSKAKAVSIVLKCLFFQKAKYTQKQKLAGILEACICPADPGENPCYQMGRVNYIPPKVYELTAPSCRNKAEFLGEDIITTVLLLNMPHRKKESSVPSLTLEKDALALALEAALAELWSKWIIQCAINLMRRAEGYLP